MILVSISKVSIGKPNNVFEYTKIEQDALSASNNYANIIQNYWNSAELSLSPSVLSPNMKMKEA